MGASIARGQSCAPTRRQAVAELHAAIVQPDMALVVFFCSPDFDLDEIAGAIANTFAGTPVVGCTTAGEIGPAGCREQSLVGASFSGADFTATTGRHRSAARVRGRPGRVVGPGSDATAREPGPP